MADNTQISSIQVPTDLTQLVKVTYNHEVLHRVLVQLINSINTLNKTVADLEKRVKALENA